MRNKKRRYETDGVSHWMQDTGNTGSTGGFARFGKFLLMHQQACLRVNAVVGHADRE
jgi:hypothetical protein